jgi:tRNA (guanine-N7-)-methyltransferase
MARLRKAARLWRRAGSVELAASVMVPDDAVFTVDPARLFGRRAPLEVELGAGKGEFIVERAAANPDRDFLAVELSAAVARVLAVRCGAARLSNLRVARMDARTLVNLMLPNSSVAAYHIYFPDPWPKERHAKHRLFTAHFVRNLARTLEPGGVVYVATDVGERAQEIFALLEEGGFVRSEAGITAAASTGFARKYHAAGRRVYAATFALSRLPSGPQNV